jgi:hypothetical protein
MFGAVIFSRVRKTAKNDNYHRHFCPSARMEQFGFHWMHFHKIWYLGIFRKSVHEIQDSLNSDKNNAYFIWRPTYIYYNISLNSS